MINQKEGCIFCKIARKEIPSHKVWEDEKHLAFLDINPVTKGHLLLIPKEHHKMMIDMPDILLKEIYVVAKSLMIKLKSSLGCDYVALSVIGTDVPHFHIHLIPRDYNDGLDGFWPTKKYKAGEAEEISKKLEKDFKNKKV